MNEKNINELEKEVLELKAKIEKLQSIEQDKILIEKSLRFKNRLQRLITIISAKFISINPNEIDYWINRTLRIVGSFAESDRAWLFQVYNDGDMMDLTNEWSDKEILPVINNANPIEIKKFYKFSEQIENNKDVIILNRNDYPTNIEREKCFLDKLESKSVVLIQLRVRDMLIGFIGLSNHRKEMVWTNEIIKFIKIVGEILINALIRKRAEDKLLQYHLIVKNTSEFMAIIDKDYYYRTVNNSLHNAFGLTENEMINLKVNQVFEKDFFENVLKPNLDLALAGKPVKFQSWFNLPELGKIYLDVLYDPLFTYNDELIGIVEISRDMTKLKLAEDELILAKEQVEKSDRLKTEFLAQISHEIRTPINSMLTFTSFIEEETANLIDDELKNSFNIIGKAGKRIIRTTDLILDMSEIQTGSYKLERETLDLYDIIDDILMDYDPLKNEKNLKFELLKNTDDTKVFCDKYSLNQILNNIIHNSIIYTFEGGVSVYIERVGKNLIAKIVDTGIGISNDYLERIYDPFSQEDQGFTRRFEGSGLGLALTKRFCELNDIEINIQSEKKKGTQIVLVFN